MAKDQAFIGNQPVPKTFRNYVATGGHVIGHPIGKLNLRISSGRAVVDGTIVSWYHQNYEMMEDATSNPRVDIVQVNKKGVLSVKKGIARTHLNTIGPYAPPTDVDHVKLAEVYIRANATHVNAFQDVHEYGCDLPMAHGRMEVPNRRIKGLNV